MFVSGNNRNYIKSFPNCNTKIYGVVGPIIGVTGLLAGMAKEKNMLSAVLLAQTFAHPIYLGVKGAKELLCVLNLKYGFKFDLKKMADEIEEIEEEPVLPGIEEAVANKVKKPVMSYFG